MNQQQIGGGSYQGADLHLLNAFRKAGPHLRKTGILSLLIAGSRIKARRVDCDRADYLRRTGVPEIGCGDGVGLGRGGASDGRCNAAVTHEWSIGNVEIVTGDVDARRLRWRRIQDGDIPCQDWLHRSPCARIGS